jgi:hypothetical protein
VTTNPVSSILAGLNGAQTSGKAGAGVGGFSQMAGMFNSIHGSSGGVLFGSVVQLTGQAITTDAATAKSLADILTALVSIAAMSGGQDPQIASVAQLLQGVKVTAAGAAIHLALSVPEAQLEGVLNGLKGSVAKPVTRPAFRPASAPEAPVAPAPLTRQ